MLVSCMIEKNRNTKQKSYLTMEQEMQRYKSIGQLRYIKIQSQTIDLRTRLWGINPHKLCIYSPEPRTEVFSLRLNFNISKLVNSFDVFIPYIKLFLFRISTQQQILVYYINTSEIPSELSRENFISSHVKITCYLHT